MIDNNLHLRRRKDGVELITIDPATMRRYAGHMGDWTCVQYVASGRRGYVKDGVLENDYVVIGRADAEGRWKPMRQVSDNDLSAAALESLREKDIAKRRKQVIDKVFGEYRDTITPNAQAALDQAIHMIMAGV